jgi:hypothetical protein
MGHLSVSSEPSTTTTSQPPAACSQLQKVPQQRDTERLQIVSLQMHMKLLRPQAFRALAAGKRLKFTSRSNGNTCFRRKTLSRIPNPSVAASKSLGDTAISYVSVPYLSVFLPSAGSGDTSPPAVAPHAAADGACADALRTLPAVDGPRDAIPPPKLPPWQRSPPPPLPSATIFVVPGTHHGRPHGLHQLQPSGRGLEGPARPPTAGPRARGGEQSVELADRSGDAAFDRLENRARWADTLHQAGRWEESAATFREAETMPAGWPPKLYSLWGFPYCDLLLGRAESEVGSGLDGLTGPGSSPEEAEQYRQACWERCWSGRGRRRSGRRRPERLS